MTKLGFPPDWNDCDLVISRQSTAVLQAGMVFHVTTAFRDIGHYGTAFSETVLIRDTGPEVLTMVPRVLVVRD